MHYVDAILFVYVVLILSKCLDLYTNTNKALIPKQIGIG
jgi:hypothetical protein